MLWECVTRQDPYSGMPPFQVVLAVGSNGLRPPISDDFPPKWKLLTTDCWDEDPNARPSFDDIMVRLEEL